MIWIQNNKKNLQSSHSPGCDPNECQTIECLCGKHFRRFVDSQMPPHSWNGFHRQSVPVVESKSLTNTNCYIFDFQKKPLNIPQYYFLPQREVLECPIDPD